MGSWRVLTTLGGFAFVATSILIPVVIHYSVFKSTMRRRQVITHVILGVAAFLLMVIATVFSTVKLVESMSSK